MAWSLSTIFALVVMTAGLTLCVYNLRQWHRGWKACRPMPFRRRSRYIRGLVFALAVTMAPLMMTSSGVCGIDGDALCHDDRFVMAAL